MTWKPVSAPPEHYSSCSNKLLLWLPYYGCQFGYHIKSGGTEPYWFAEGFSVEASNTVTHWQELPEKP